MIGLLLGPPKAPDLLMSDDGRVLGLRVLRSNATPDVLRSLGDDLKNVADELTAPPEPGDTSTDQDRR